MTNIGDRIRDRRIKAGLTAEQLARKLEKSRATIYRYESSDAENMPISVLTPLAKALGTTPADLMGWEAPSAKATINDNSLEQDLFQYYTHRPKTVQMEILNRLKDMDITFAKNVRNLLKQSGDVNGFMQHTDLDFETVGKFMQGEPTRISSDAAEKVAKFFKVDVVDLYFDELNNDDTKFITDLEINDDDEEEAEIFRTLNYTQTGFNLGPFFDNIFETPHPSSLVAKCEELCSDKSLDKFIRKFISIEEELYAVDDLDYPRIYEIIADLIVQDPDGFMKKYVQQENQAAALKILRSYVKDNFR